MANEIERYLRQAEEENPELSRGIARVRAVMWGQVARGQFPEHVRGFSEQTDVYNHPSFDFIASDARVIIEGELVSLTLAENKILTELCRNLNRAVTRERLMEVIAYDHAVDYDLRTVNVHISHLRRKIAKDREIGSPIETVQKIGYRLVDHTVPNGYGNGNGHQTT